jgi:hypothetical protein
MNHSHRIELLAAKRAGIESEIESIKARHKAEVLADSKRRQVQMNANFSWLKAYSELCAEPRPYSPI